MKRFLRTTIAWKYKIATDTWEQKASLSIRNIVSGVAFTIGNKAYAALGVVSDSNLPPPAERGDFWEYEPTRNTWTKKADVGGGLHWLSTGFAVGGKGYIGLGTGDIVDDVKTDFWEYTPE